MKIKSNFSDYYDPCCHADFSSDLSWYRNMTIQKVSEPLMNAIKQCYPLVTWVDRVENPKLYKTAEYSHIFESSKVVVYINGQYFIGLKIKDQFVYTSDDLNKYLDRLSSDIPASHQKQIIDWFNKGQHTFEKLKPQLPMLDVPIQVTIIGHSFMSNEHVELKIRDMIRDYLYSTYKHYIDMTCAYVSINNFKLDLIQFYRVMPNYLLAQEVAMYVANQVNPENNMVEIADKDRIVQHGFDIKASFRKRKSV